MRKLFTLLGLLTATLSSSAQVFVTENFDYATGTLTTVGGGNVSGGTWVNISGTSNPINVVAGSLSYTGYPQSGIGNKVRIQAIYGTAEDAITPLSAAISTDTVFYSFLLNVADTVGLAPNIDTSGAGYFTGFIPGTSTSIFYGRVHIRKGQNGNTYSLGIRTTSDQGFHVSYANKDLNPGETYYIVAAFIYNPGPSNNETRLWINPPQSSTTPSAPDAVSGWPGTLTENANGIQRIFIRQGFQNASGSSVRSSTPNADLDGFRVATNWADVRLPLNLLSFNASMTNRAQILNWTTSGEFSTQQFEVERSENGSSFRRIQTVQAKGSANYNSYQVEDIQSATGTVYYRIRMIDKDGSYKYSRTLSLSPARKGRFSIYPNPLPGGNQLTITHSETSGKATIGIYTADGRQLLRHAVPANAVQTSLNIGDLPAGTYRVVLDNNGNRQSELLIKQ